jgi:hypothetical protein
MRMTNTSFVNGLLGTKTLASGRSLRSSCRKSKMMWLSRLLGLRAGWNMREKTERFSSMKITTLTGRAHDPAPRTPNNQTIVIKMATPICTIQTCSGTNSLPRTLSAGILSRTTHTARCQGNKTTTVRCAKLRGMKPSTAFTTDVRST